MNHLLPIIAWCKENAWTWPIVSAVIVLVFKPRSPAEYARLSGFKPAWFWTRFAPLMQLIGALGFDPVKALQIVGKVAYGKQDSDITPKDL